MVEKGPALRDHVEQAAARVVVLLVGLEVLGQVGDPFGEDRDLDLRRAGVAFGPGVGVDDFSLAGQLLPTSKGVSFRSGEMKDARGIEPSRPHLAERHDPASFTGGNHPGGSEPRLQGFNLPGEQNDRTSLRQPEGVFGGHGQLRDVVQGGLDRKQNLQRRAFLAHLLKFFQCNRVFRTEAADARAAQVGDVGAGAEGGGQVAGQGADVGALAAVDLEDAMVGVRAVDEAGVMDGDEARLRAPSRRLRGRGRRPARRPPSPPNSPAGPG